MNDDNPVPMTPKRIGAIFSAYTGVLCGTTEALQEYAQEKVGHEVRVSDLADVMFGTQLKVLAKDDFMALHRWCGGK